MSVEAAFEALIKEVGIEEAMHRRHLLHEAVLAEQPTLDAQEKHRRRRQIAKRLSPTLDQGFVDAIQIDTN